MKFWILLILAILLLMWGFRESFQPTASIQAPPYDEDDNVRIYNLIRNNGQSVLMAKARASNPDLVRLLTMPSAVSPSDRTIQRKLEAAAGSLVSPAVASFFTTVYTPATTPITAAQIDTFMVGRTSDIKDIEKEVITTYFMGQSGIGGAEYTKLLVSQGYSGDGYAQQNKVEGTTTGTTAGTTVGTTAGTTAGTTTGTTAGTTTGTTAGTTTGTTAGTTAGTTTGTTVGITAGRTQMVFGPTFTGLGSGGSVSPADTSLTNRYPELIGGGGSSTSAAASGSRGFGFNFGGDFGAGALPSTGGLGSDPNNRFFPTSRQPGDMETIPDPYRVSQQFQASSYSFKTEPTAFLTDFSAFYS